MTTPDMFNQVKEERDQARQELAAATQTLKDERALCGSYLADIERLTNKLAAAQARVRELEAAAECAEDAMEEARDLLQIADAGTDEYNTSWSLEGAKTRLWAVRTNTPLCGALASTCKRRETMTTNKYTRAAEVIGCAELLYEPNTQQSYAAYLYRSADWWREAMRRVVPCARDMALAQQETAAIVSRQDRRARGVE